ncbi:MAG: Gfo/Idh/MocA family protein [Candidatus Helarchaeota archaeon]
MKKPNTAVIGAGWFGSAHVRVFNSVSNLVAICDTDVVKAEQLAKKYDINYYKNHLDLLKNEELDAISIVIPPRNIPKVAEDYASKGINVLLEKPMGTDLTMIKPLLKFQDVRLMCGFIELFNPVVKCLKKNIKKIGTPIMVSSRRIGRYPHRSWNLGVLLDLGIHCIYVQRYLFGDIIDIKSMLSYASNSKFEDAAFLLLNYKNNVHGLIETNWLTPTKHRKLIVYGEKGTIEIDYITQELKFTKIEKLEDEYKITKLIQPYNSTEPLMEEVKAFLFEKENPIPLKDGIKSLEVALKAQSSYINK